MASEPDPLEELRRIEAEEAALRKKREELQARLAGSGAIAQQGSVAAGAGGAAIDGDVGGDVLINSTKIVYAGDDPKAAQALLNRYLKWLVNECAPLRLKAIDQGAARPGQKPLGLTSVYVDLNTQHHIDAQFATLADCLADPVSREALRLGAAIVSATGGNIRPVSALEALACHDRLVFLGAPGSGKSTLSAYLALSLAQAGLGIDAALKRLGVGWAFGPILPVRIVLRQFAASLPADLPHGRAGHLWEFVAHELTDSGLPDKTGSLLRDVAQKSGALFLLDGLDEAGDETRRTRVLEAVNEFMQNAGERCRFLLTARPYAWEEEEQRIAQIPDAYRLADFDEDQIAIFIERWYQAISAVGWVNANEAVEKARELGNVTQRPDLLPLARNPLLLTLMATLHSNRTRLPDDRADLYHAVVELLLQRWNEPSGMDRSLLASLNIPTLKLSDLREAIERMAFDAHQAHVGREGAADISESVLLEAFCSLLGNSLDKARLVVDYIENRAGLLVGQGRRAKIRRFTFPHRTFQEFLAACHLAGRADFLEQAVDLTGVAPMHWREVLVLAARQAGPGRGTPVADALVHMQSVDDYRRRGGAPTEVDWRSAIVAGAQLLEIGLAVLDSRESYRVVRERATGWLRALIETARSLPLQDRIEAGRLLGRLGDPRDLEELVAVPAGKFRMGSDKTVDYLAYDAELPQHEVNVAAFKISKYPVTVGLWKRFVEATGYACDPDSLGGVDNHPAHDVSWRDARACCEWLTQQWRAEKRITLDEVVRLPTEAEWEKAARGDLLSPVTDAGGVRGEGEARIWPWGNTFDPNQANVAATAIGGTSAVGCFPSGASPYGCLDMIGNVWEWTQSKYKDYPYRSDDGREGLSGDDPRVVRGGAFNNDEFSARCASRFSARPDFRLDSLGLRVVVSAGSRT